MKLVGAGSQVARHYLYDASGTLTAGGTAQLVMGQSQARSHLILGNNSVGPLWFEFGSARAKATITNGVITGLTVTNAGFGFTKPPVVTLLGGGAGGNSTYLGLGQPNAPAPSHPGVAHAVLTSNAVSSIVIDDPGAGYAAAPYVFIYNSDLDPNGCAVPSANVGILIPGGGQALVWNGTCCPTDPIAVFGATTGQGFTAKWMD